MPRKESTTGHISAQAQQDLVSDGIENYELPKSIVTKISKSAIPENAKLQKETTTSLVKGTTVFINYLSATAHDVAMSKQHKSISASDVLKALEIIEFGDLNDTLNTELQVYRNNIKAEKSRKERADKLAAKGKAKEALGSTITPISVSASAKGKTKAIPVPQVSAVASGTLEMADADVVMGGEKYIENDTEMPLNVYAEDGSTSEEEEEEDEEVEEDLIPDPMVVEQDELRRDANGLEEGHLAAAAAADD
ncbi:hypothetical protein HWV62_5274 [Athelia sp. TMB]|nr:hypothetical protein HWV62_5274 [Athelia sp. TMB]